MVKTSGGGRWKKLIWLVVREDWRKLQAVQLSLSLMVLSV